MNHRLFHRPSVVLVLTLILAACAAAPRTPRAPRAAAPVVVKPQPAPARAPGEMAPIPNPQGAATARPAAPRPAGRPARATPPRPAASAANLVRASQLRAQGLEQLNRGAVDRAIALLQQASQLDPGNALIKRDLDRALRIGAAVKRK